MRGVWGMFGRREQAMERAGALAAGRAALRVLEYAWGKPKEELAVALETPENPLDLTRMTHDERQALIARAAREHPDLAAALLGPRAVRDTYGS